MHLDLQTLPHNSHLPASLILTGLANVFEGMEVYHRHCIQHRTTCIRLPFPVLCFGPRVGKIDRRNLTEDGKDGYCERFQVIVHLFFI